MKFNNNNYYYIIIIIIMFLLLQFNLSYSLECFWAALLFLTKQNISQERQIKILKPCKYIHNNDYDRYGVYEGDKEKKSRTFEQ